VWKNGHNLNLTIAPSTKRQFTFRRNENKPRPKFANVIPATTKRAKYAIAIILQISSDYKVSWGLGHALSFYHALRKFDGDQIDLVLWVVDLYDSHPKKIVGDEKIWRYLESLPGLFIMGGGLCSEFDLTMVDIKLDYGKHAPIAVMAQMKKLKTITLDMYERVAQIDWDILPIKPFLGMFKQDMLGAKVMAGTDNVGPFFGGIILLEPDYRDYRNICENILPYGWGGNDRGWKDWGTWYLSPFCPGPGLWHTCDPPGNGHWQFHGARSDQGLFFYYYGLIHDWVITIDQRHHYYRKFNSEVFEGGTWTETGIVDVIHFKGSDKLQRMLAHYDWRENMYEAYHSLNMSQIEIFKEFYEVMLAHWHGTANSWE